MSRRLRLAGAWCLRIRLPRARNEDDYSNASPFPQRRPNYLVAEFESRRKFACQCRRGKMCIFQCCLKHWVKTIPTFNPYPNSPSAAIADPAAFSPSLSDRHPPYLRFFLFFTLLDRVFAFAAAAPAEALRPSDFPAPSPDTTLRTTPSIRLSAVR